MSNGPQVGSAWFPPRQGPVLSSVGTEAALDYQTLCRSAASRAALLLEAGLSPGEVVAISVASPWLASQWICAALWKGAAVLPVNPDWPVSQRNQILALAGCRCLVSDQPLLGQPDGLIWLNVLTVPETELERSPPLVTEPDGLGLVVATSGSTGEPRGVMLSYANLVHAARALNLRLSVDRHSRWLNLLPLRHIGGLSILYRCLLAGAEMVLAEQFDAGQTMRWLHERNITHVSLVPTMLYRLLGIADAKPPPSLRVALIGGAALSPELAEQARQRGWPLCVSYGMSETSALIACDCAENAGAEAGYVGKVLPGNQLRCADDGSIEIKGRNVMLGYLNQGLQPGEGIESGWFRSGDLGWIDDHGGVHITGRRDQVVICGGVNVMPKSVEAKLLQLPRLREVVVLDYPSEEWGTALAALYVGDVTPDEMQGWARNHLSGPERPKHYIQLSSLPRDAMGKHPRSELLALLRQAQDFVP